jgi:hypothetical protein
MSHFLGIRQMTDRQRCFLNAFLANDLRNATAAAALAGYAWPDRQGSRLRSYPEIARAIQAERERIRKVWDTKHKARLRAIRAEPARPDRPSFQRWLKRTQRFFARRGWSMPDD